MPPLGAAGLGIDNHLLSPLNLMPDTVPAAVADRHADRRILVELTGSLNGLVIEAARNCHAATKARFRITDTLRIYAAAAPRLQQYQSVSSVASVTEGTRALLPRHVTVLREYINGWFYQGVGEPAHHRARRGRGAGRHPERQHRERRACHEPETAQP